MVNLGTHLAKLRWSAGLTVGQLSRLSQVSQRTIELAESGSTEIGLIEFIEICECLNVDFLTLLSDESLQEVNESGISEGERLRAQAKWRFKASTLSPRKTRIRARVN